MAKTKSERLTGKCPTCGKTVRVTYNAHHNEFFYGIHNDKRTGFACTSAATVATEINYHLNYK